MSEFEPSTSWLGAPADDDEFWPEAVGYGQAAGPARARPVGNRYPAPDGHGPDSWQEWQRQPWNDWVPPPELHPDHPSAPVPRIQLPADHPSGPMPAARPPGPSGLPQRRPGPPGTGQDNGNRRLHVVPNDDPAEDRRPAPRTREDPRRRLPGPPAADQYWPETIDYHSQASPLQPEPQYQAEQFPAEEYQTGQFQDEGPSVTDSLWTAGQVLSLADGQAAQIKQEARDYAAAVRDAAEREAAAITEQAAGHAAAMTDQATGQAAAIREAMEREAARRRAELDSMSDELRRMAAYITENLVAPAMPGTAPAMPFNAPPMPATVPAPPGARPARPATRSAPPAPPATRPARPERQPGSGPARPDTQPRTKPGKPESQPGTRPARPVTLPGKAPAKKPQKQPRQLKAMKVATAATAALLSVALISGATELGLHGYKFFVFRQAGTGSTGDQETDQQFLAREAAAAHHTAAAPKGRHHKTSDQKTEVHH